MQTFHRGFTIIELLIVLALMSVIMLLAMPSQHAQLTTKKFDHVMAQMLEALRIARQEALARGMTVTLCPYHETQSCGEDWSRGVMLFADEMAEGNITDPTQLIVKLAFSVPDMHVFLNAFPSGTNEFFQFAGNGFTHNQNGSFYFCPQGANLLAQRIVINQAGRAYITQENADTKCNSAY